MSDGAEATQAQLVLPPSVVSKADVARLVNDLERVDNEMTTGAVRERVGAQPIALPPMSQQLTDFLQQNNLQLGDSNARTMLVQNLRTLKDSVPIVHMTFAVEADRESLGQLAQWLRESVHPQAVIAVGLQPALVAGVYLRTTNQVIDLSMRGALKAGREVLTQELGALRG